jgi:hypothetical protein
MSGEEDQHETGNSDEIRTNSEQPSEGIVKRPRDEEEETPKEEDNNKKTKTQESQEVHESRLEPKVENGHHSTSNDNGKLDTEKPIIQHLTYEDVTKIAAAQLSLSTLPIAQNAALFSATVTPLNIPLASTINSIVSPSGDSEIIETSKEKVGQIIGSKGAIIQDMVIYFVISNTLKFNFFANMYIYFYFYYSKQEQELKYM